MYQFAKGTCPNAHKYSKQLITLPIHLDMTEKDCNRVIDIIKEEI